MKVYLAGTPGTEEREMLAEDSIQTPAFLLGYPTESIFRSLCL